MNYRLAVAAILLIVGFTSACNHWVPRLVSADGTKRGESSFCAVERETWTRRLPLSNP